MKVGMDDGAEGLRLALVQDQLERHPKRGDELHAAVAVHPARRA